MPKIIDPDNLVRDTSIFFEIANPEIRSLGISSSLQVPTSDIPPLSSGSDSGVSGQAVYSFCKEQWKSQSDLIRIPFPLISITKGQFEWFNNWDLVDNQSRNLVRDAGWSVTSASITTQEYVGIVTLGALGATDQVYFQQGNILSSSVNFVMSGTVNQAIQQFSQSSAQVEFDSRQFTKLFVREYQKIYAGASIQVDLAVAGDQETIVYSIPLTNAVDLKITTDLEGQATGSPYTDVSINYLTGSGFGSWAAQAQAAGTVIQDPLSSSLWFITQGGGTSAGTGVEDDSGITDWLEWSASIGGGERLIGPDWFAFNVIIDAGSGKSNTIGQIYTRVQFELRLETDIDDGDQFSQDFTGKTTDLLLRFLGDTLITSDGVFIDNFQDADTNSIDFFDISGSVRRFPFVAAGTINFNDNLIADLQAEYFMFFTSVPSGTFGSASAVIVEDNLVIAITGSVSGSGSVSFTFDYDNNAQGGRTPNSDATVTVVAIGLNTSQYVSTAGTIARSKTNIFTLVGALERNFSNP